MGYYDTCLHEAISCSNIRLVKYYMEKTPNQPDLGRINQFRFRNNYKHMIIWLYEYYNTREYPNFTRLYESITNDLIEVPCNKGNYVRLFDLCYNNNYYILNKYLTCEDTDVYLRILDHK